jgi:hypothetical protein
LRVSLTALPQKQPNSPVALVLAWCASMLAGMKWKQGAHPCVSPGRFIHAGVDRSED